jgi:hypothetical protein
VVSIVTWFSNRSGLTLLGPRLGVISPRETSRTACSAIATLATLAEKPATEGDFRVKGDYIVWIRNVEIETVGGATVSTFAAGSTLAAVPSYAASTIRIVIISRAPVLAFATVTTPASLTTDATVPTDDRDS